MRVGGPAHRLCSAAAAAACFCCKCERRRCEAELYVEFVSECFAPVFVDICRAEVAGILSKLLRRSAQNVCCCPEWNWSEYTAVLKWPLRPTRLVEVLSPGKTINNSPPAWNVAAFQLFSFGIISKPSNECSLRRNEMKFWL